MKAHFKLIAVFITFIFACSGTKSYQNKAGDKYLHFGFGGGFSGINNHYFLYSNGNLLKRKTLSKDDTLIKTVSEKKVSSIFKRLNNAGIDTMDLSNTGNMNYWLGIENKNDTIQLKWSETGVKPSDNILSVYNQLIELTKEKSSSK